MKNIDVKEEIKSLEQKLELHFQKKKSSGLAIVITHEKEIIYSQCYGYRDIENNISMTEDTLFNIASISKSFTAASIAFLVDQGLLAWDEPLRKKFPQFRTSDKFVNEHVTLRDLLSHRTGLSGHDMMWYLDDNFTYEKLLSRMPYLEFSKDLRETYQYNNLMFYVAAKIVEEFSDMKFSAFLKEKILNPLGMEDTTLSDNEAFETQRMAKPYKNDPKGIHLMNYHTESTPGAGGIKTTPKDLAKWLMFQYNQGKIGDKSLIAPKIFSQLHKPTTIIEEEDRDLFPKKNWRKMESYGLGWFISMYRGFEVITHTGGIDGFNSQVTFLPDNNIGIVVLANEYPSILHKAVSNEILDIILDLERWDWMEESTKTRDSVKNAQRDMKKLILNSAKQHTHPSFPLTEYKGKYKHPGYPIFEIIQNEEKQLVLKTPRFEFPLVHVHYDTFMLYFYLWDEYWPVIFNQNADGEITKFEIQLDELLPPLKFERQPDNALRDERLLKLLIGTYDFLNNPLVIQLKNSTSLEAVFLGETPVELFPLRNLRFQIRNSLMKFTFIQDENDEYRELHIRTTNSIYKCNRMD
ncbi:D-aminopeptidase [Candidatus Lokiarchaeum ossiferum]|uniref:D-aminopeptidase n=1 Tax=Candidatus Lokiarchaeum ossiferum TaxID=2951803 RepID=A0ABY6HY94_9ARCH|nr:D-aminopeptidase [Candidatus Lokiarchaeum sp. B-35]